MFQEEIDDLDRLDEENRLNDLHFIDEGSYIFSDENGDEHDFFDLSGHGSVNYNHTIATTTATTNMNTNLTNNTSSYEPTRQEEEEYQQKEQEEEEEDAHYPQQSFSPGRSGLGNRPSTTTPSSSSYSERKGKRQQTGGEGSPILTESIERELAQRLDLTMWSSSHRLDVQAQLSHLMKEVHQKNVSLQAMQIEVNHLRLAGQGLVDQEREWRQQRDEARMKQAQAEQDKMILEARLSEVARFEGVPSGISMEVLRGQLLTVANTK
eukprot:scaffold525_cov170-Ochromonas_danica.AAC.8